MNSMSLSMSMMPGMSMPDATATTTTASVSTKSSILPTATSSDNKGSMSGMTMDGYTCFLSPGWKIRTAGGFAGLCIGIILMTIFLQALGWFAKFYDRRLVRIHEIQVVALATKVAHSNAGTNAALIAKNAHNLSPTATFRPNLLEQAFRTLIRTVQFALAYWIMLMAMYYNGFIIICIIIGTFIGTYIFQWERMGGPHGSVPGGHSEPTGCCG
ncbi:hypothetical protein TruAng_003115 [Truncatella angustata]|nr:hypothetical protein TruAng_003115 [Truncatella angustata]